MKTRIKGRQRILTIGRHGKGAYTSTKARNEAIRLLGLIRDGRDPAGDKQAEKQALTFGEFATRYMSEYAARHKKRRTIEEGRSPSEDAHSPRFAGPEGSGRDQGRCSSLP